MKKGLAILLILSSYSYAVDDAVGIATYEDLSEEFRELFWEVNVPSKLVFRAKSHEQLNPYEVKMKRDPDADFEHYKRSPEHDRFRRINQQALERIRRRTQSAGAILTNANDQKDTSLLQEEQDNN